MRVPVEDPLFGFLEIAGGGDGGPWIGGYLIVSASGRPLEFHCTAPVEVSRAQRILYGRSLRRFVCGEHLGAALVGRAKLKPHVLLISDPAAADAGISHGVPTVHVPPHNGQEPGAAGFERLPSTAPAWGCVRNTALAADAGDRLASLLDLLVGAVDLAEPFERVREAIGEAQRGAAAADDAPGAPHRDAA